MADQDNIILTYRRALDGDESAQTDLWRELRAHMLRVIRLKAADLRAEWAAEADEIYDVFLVEMFNCEKSIRFDDAFHFTCYIEKALRRRTVRTVHASRSLCRLQPAETFERKVAPGDFVQRIIQRDELYAALVTLTRREQKICVLFAEGYRWHEIGQLLGLADDTGRMIFRRALARIRDEVSPPAHSA